MADKSFDDLARQLAQHLDSLRSAGVEFVPGAEPAPVPSLKKLASVPLPQVSTFAPDVVRGGLFAPPPIEAVAASDAEGRVQALAELARQVSQCTRCPQLASTRTQTVFGVGPLDPDLCFVGEAPGADEDRLGEPFVGAAGQLLTRIIAACGMKREEVFICNVLRCRPPGNRQPLPEEAGHCNEWLEKTIELVRPKFLVALGNIPAQHLLGTTVGITRLRGKYYEYRGIPLMCTFHPSYLLRSPEKKKDVWEDMKALLARIGRPIPGQS